MRHSWVASMFFDGFEKTSKLFESDLKWLDTPKCPKASQKFLEMFQKHQKFSSIFKIMVHSASHAFMKWKTDSNSIEIIDEESLRHIHSIRLKGDSEIEILTDPWSEDSAIWEYDLNQESLNRIRSFRDYLDSPYTDDVLW